MTRYKQDHNIVYRSGLAVVKEFCGSGALRRFQSETRTRRLLSDTTRFVPISATRPTIPAIVLPYVEQATRGVSNEELGKFIELSRRLLARPKEALGERFGWLGDDSRPHDSLREFVLSFINRALELSPGNNHLKLLYEWYTGRSDSCFEYSEPTLCLGDISLVNCFIAQDELVLFDLESSSASTREIEATRLCINLLMNVEHKTEDIFSLIDTSAFQKSELMNGLVFNVARYVTYSALYKGTTRSFQQTIGAISADSDIYKILETI